MSVLKIKIKCLPPWGANAGPPLMIRLSSRCQGHTDWLWTSWSVFLETFQECSPDLFHSLCSDKQENRASLEQFLGVRWKGLSWDTVFNLSQIKLFSIITIDGLLVIVIEKTEHRILSWGSEQYPLIIKDQSMNQNHLFCVTDAVFTQWFSLAMGGLVPKENWNWLFYHMSYSSPKDLSVLHCKMTSDIVVSE